MPRGQPDFGMYQTKNVGATLADIGEGVVRLGSIVEYDRRGDIVWFDDFEAPVLRWNTSIAPGGAIALDSESVKNGAQAVKLTTPIGLGASVSLQKSLEPLGTRKIGGEISFSKPTAAYQFFLTLIYDDGTTRYTGQVNINFATNVISIQTVFTPIDTRLAFVNIVHSFTPIKLVVDFITGYYVRLLVGDTEYDLSTYPLETAGGGPPPIYFVDVGLANLGGLAKSTLWLDNFIYTQNEP